MKKTFTQSMQIIFYNIKTLLLFEIIYRLIGVLFIYPVSRILLNFAIKLSGYSYITNAVFMDFILMPTTILMIFLMLIFVSLYITIEIVVLLLLFDLSYHQESINLYKLLYLGIRRVGRIIWKYHVFLTLPSFLFLLIILSFQTLGLVVFIDLPNYIRSQILTNQTLTISFSILMIAAVIGFMETMFSMHLFSVAKKKIKEGYYISRKILKKSRLRMMLQFMFINFTINLVLYAIYGIVIVIMGLFMSLTKDQEYVLGFLLTALYSTYTLIGLIASILIVPVNLALISVWYYDYTEPHPSIVKTKKLRQLLMETLQTKWFKRGLIFVLLTVFILNITSVFSIVVRPNDRIDLLGSIEIVAHRGASKDAPENTLKSIELAIEQGADTVEFDVRLSQDGIPVLFHDETVIRTTNAYQATRLESMLLDDIKTLDAGFWFSSDYINEPIPTFEEVLELIDRRIQIFVDVKTHSSVMNEILVGIIETYEMEDMTTFLSTDKTQLYQLKTLNPEIKTLLLLTSFYGDINALSKDDLIDYIGLQHTFIENAYGIISHLQRNGKRVYAWTVSDERDMERVLKFGLDGMITSRPSVAREVIYRTQSSDLVYELLSNLFSSR